MFSCSLLPVEAALEIGEARKVRPDFMLPITDSSPLVSLHEVIEPTYRIML
jgi:hypothetical protein